MSTLHDAAESLAPWERASDPIRESIRSDNLAGLTAGRYRSLTPSVRSIPIALIPVLLFIRRLPWVLLGVAIGEVIAHFGGSIR